MSAEEIAQRKIDQQYSIRIIVDQRIVPNDVFHWNDENEYGGWITLSEISERLSRLDYPPPYYVWEDTPLRGTIYQFGNYYPEKWQEYGNTKGFA